MLSLSDIRDIHNKVSILPQDKYVPLPLHLNDKKWKWEGKDFPRVIALLEFREYMLKYGMSFKSVLSFNGDKDPEYEYIKYNKKHNYNYADNTDKYDLHKIDLGRCDFDFVMLNQTIEHLYNPILAIKNIYNHMADGGVMYINAPVNGIPHSTPFHYYTGVTAVGLGTMMKLAGFEILELSQWGNLVYFKQMFHNVWSDYKYDINSGHNDHICPIITWCLAIKK